MSDELYHATEPATPFRQRQARRAGQLPRSAELNSVLVLLAGLVILVALCPTIFAQLKAFTVQMLSSPPSASHSPASLDQTLALLRQSAWRFLLIAGPACLAVAGAVLLSGLLQSGFFFSVEPLAFKLDRLSPTQGFKRIFSARSLARLIFNLAKVLLVALVTILSIRAILPDLARLPALPPQLLLTATGRLVLGFGLRLIMLLAVLAAFDYLLVRHFLKRDLRMSAQQLRQEHRDLEGNPLTQQRRSSLAAPSPARLAAAILQADLVLIDSSSQPSSAGPRLAIALQHRTITGPSSPVRLLIKGSGALARRIHILAAQRRLGIFNYPELTRALARAVPVNHYVPLRLYPQLAELLGRLWPAISSDRERLLTADLAN
jgi:flagellar biosynthetic protein FlhB